MNANGRESLLDFLGNPSLAKELRVHSRPFAVTHLLLKEEVFQIVGTALEVLNGLGHFVLGSRAFRK